MFQRTRLAVAVASALNLLLVATGGAQASLIIDTSKTLNYTEEIIQADGFIESEGLNFGITTGSGVNATINANLLHVIGSQKTVPVSLLYLNNNSTLTINSNLKGEGTGDFVSGLYAQDGNFTINGNVEFSFSADSEDCNLQRSYFNPSGIHLEKSTGAITGDRFIVESKNSPSTGVFLENHSKLDFDVNTFNIVGHATSGNNQWFGITAHSGSQLSIKSSTMMIDLKGSNLNGMLTGISVANLGMTNEGSPSQENSAIFIDTKTLGINLENFSEQSVGILSSGEASLVKVSSEETAINVNGAGDAFGLAAMDGGQFLSTNAAGVTHISVQGQGNAIGIYSNQGTVEMLGQTVIKVEGSGEESEVSGILISSSELQDIQETTKRFHSFSNLTISATGTNGAKANGIRAKDALMHLSGTTAIEASGKDAKGLKVNATQVELSGATTIKAIGENVSGISAKDALIHLSGTTAIEANGDMASGLDLLGSSQLVLSGSARINGSYGGIRMLGLPLLSLSKGASLVTNSMMSHGVTELDKGAVFEVTGLSKMDYSEMGTFNSNDASIYLGSGAFEFTELNLQGQDNRLVLNNLSNIERVNIENKSGSYTLVASSESNDQYITPLETAQALLSKVKIDKDSVQGGDKLIVDPGTINDGVVADIKTDASGNQTLENYKETKNDKLDAYASVTALSALSLRHEMNSLSKRMGELRDAPADAGAWVRGYGSEMEYGAQNVKAKNNSIQVGSDYTIGDWKVGAAFSYTDGESTYDKGSADNKGYGVAVYGTWFVPCGAYIDLMAKYNRLDNDFALNGMNGSYDNDALAVSAETGYRFNFMDGGVYVEPQVGLSYGQVKGETIKTSNGVTLEQDDYDSFIGRVGVRTGFKFPKDKGTIYARVSGVYDFQGEVNGKASMGQSTNTFEADLGGAWLEMGVGANFNWTKNTYTYIDFERTNGGDVKENYRWNIGVRHTF